MLQAIGVEQWSKDVKARLRFGRAGGYSGLDIVLLLFFYFSSGLKCGIKEFCRLIAKAGYRLAAMAGRLSLPTQSSMSRGLKRVEFSQLRPFADWLLLEACGARELLRHAACFTRDRFGQAWSFFDFDPTVTAIRQRKLPKDEALPEAQRRAAQAEPGYSGRKRGEIQIKRSTLQHAGSGLWLLGEFHAGNMGTLSSWKRALRRVVETCLFAELELERAVIRGDGECGSVPFIHASIEANVHYVSRSSAYHMLNDPAVARHLADALWEKVPSSGSGPCRYATELGEVTLTASGETKKSHGVEYPPVSTRMVVSRFEAESKRGSGVFIDGWQYELYPNDLPVESWSAADVVWSYYGRTGQENRFGQEDREFELDRIYSHNLAGQELAVNVGLFVWNQRLCRGFELAAPGQDVPAQTPCQSDAVILAPLPAASEETDTPSMDEATTQSDAPSGDLAEQEADSSVIEATQALTNVLSEANLEEIVERLGPNWSKHPSGLKLVCPNNVELPLLCVETAANRNMVHYRAPKHTCGQCPHFDRCSRSANPMFRKQVASQSLSPEVAAEIKHRLESYKKAQRQQARREQKTVHLPPTATGPKKRPQRATTLTWLARSMNLEQGFAPSSPMLLPANLRKIFTRTCEEIEVDITASLWVRRRQPMQLRVIANSEADRQNRRQSYADRNRWNALPGHAVVKIKIEAPPALEQMLKQDTVLSRRSAA